MEKSNILFRVDGNTQMGLGHIVRCIALAQMLCIEFDIIFFCKAVQPSVFESLKANNLRLRHINDEESFIQEIGKNDIVVLDGYHFDVQYQQNIKALAYKLVCVDDLHEMEFVADLIINHTPGISPSDYKAPANTQFALGLDYVLLRPLFLQQATKPRQQTGKVSVLICFGGADPKNLTAQVLNIVLTSQIFEKIVVITGPSYIYADTVKQTADVYKNVIYLSGITEEEMLAEMLAVDVAIVPTSGILFETMAAGCKIISGYYVDNQKILYGQLKSTDAFIPAGNFLKHEVEDAITEFLADNKPVAKLIDGQSGKRILNKFYGLLASLRPARDADCERLFYWANDPVVRANAFNSNTIVFEDHKAWFNKKLNNENAHIYILSYKGNDAGLIRFDIADNIATISYLIDDSYRGMGLGTWIVEKGVQEMALLNNVKTINALVKPLNISSIKVFRRLGFSERIEQNEMYGEICVFNLYL